MPQCIGKKPGDGVCDGKKALVCGPDLVTSTTEDCAFACKDGKCQGTCAPASKQCSGQTPQTCDAAGQWQSGGACQGQACVNGACTGVCSPGAKQCSGSVPQTCDASGQWANGAACSGGTPACNAGTCVAPCAAEVAAGDSHTCARKTDGTLWCWGRNDSGQLGDGSKASPKPSPVQVTSLGNAVAGVAAGGAHTCARRTDGTLWCWGYNGDGQVGDGTTTGQACSGYCAPSPVKALVCP